MAKTGGGDCPPPDFGRIKDAARQRYRATLLLAHPDFQTCRSYIYLPIYRVNIRTAGISKLTYVVGRDDLGLTSMEISQNHAHLIESLTA